MLLAEYHHDVYGVADTLNISTLPVLTPGFFLSHRVHMNVCFAVMSFFPVPFDLKKTNEMYKNTMYAKTNAGVAWGAKKLLRAITSPVKSGLRALRRSQLGCGHVMLVEEIKCVNTFMRNFGTPETSHSVA